MVVFSQTARPKPRSKPVDVAAHDVTSISPDFKRTMTAAVDPTSTILDIAVYVRTARVQVNTVRDQVLFDNFLLILSLRETVRTAEERKMNEVSKLHERDQIEIDELRRETATMTDRSQIDAAGTESIKKHALASAAVRKTMNEIDDDAAHCQSQSEKDTQELRIALGITVAVPDSAASPPKHS
jgi:hypothetical protein